MYNTYYNNTYIAPVIEATIPGRLPLKKLALWYSSQHRGSLMDSVLNIGDLRTLYRTFGPDSNTLTVQYYDGKDWQTINT